MTRLLSSPDDVLRQFLRVIFVHPLDDSHRQPAGGVALGLLVDGHLADALAPQVDLERFGVLAPAGEATESPNENDLEGGLAIAALLDHLPELGPVGDSAALGHVHVLAGLGVAVGLGVLLKRPQLDGHGKDRVLPVAGHPGVERRGCERL